jgi:hypothetical protein
MELSHDSLFFSINNDPLKAPMLESPHKPEILGEHRSGHDRH